MNSWAKVPKELVAFVDVVALPLIAPPLLRGGKGGGDERE